MVRLVGAVGALRSAAAPAGPTSRSAATKAAANHRSDRDGANRPIIWLPPEFMKSPKWGRRTVRRSPEYTVFHTADRQNGVNDCQTLSKDGLGHVRTA